jgi:hypothetical protein
MSGEMLYLTTLPKTSRVIAWLVLAILQALQLCKPLSSFGRGIPFIALISSKDFFQHRRPFHMRLLYLSSRLC